MLMSRIGCPASVALLFFILPATAPAQSVSGGVSGGIIQGAPGVIVQGPPRDRVPPPRTGTGSVKGRVVDGVSGNAIARARVTLQGPTRVTVVTDASGAFAFANLPPGSINLGVDKATYLNTRFPTPGRTVRTNFRPVMLADGQAMEGVVIPMFHGASIAGRVVDANGDPVDFAQVSALRIPGPGRIGRPMMRGGVSTDDRGEFRVGRLEAGTYLLQVSARRGPSPDDMGTSAAPGTAPLPQPLPTYYPGVLSLEQAQPITIEKGQSATDIEIALAEGIPGTVIGTVTMSNGSGFPAGNAYVNVRRVTTEANRMDGFSTGTAIRPDGTFRLVLAPGDYMIEARVSPRMMNSSPRPEDEQFGNARVTVASGSEDAVAITVGHGATATGRVVFDTSTPPPPSPGRARVPLFSENGECRSGDATIAADWTFKIEGLSGTCSTPPNSMFGGWMVKGVIVAGENTVDTPVTFQPDQQLRNVQVIVTDKRPEMAFHVSDESGQPTRDYVVLAYPIQRSRWTTSVRTFTLPPIDPMMMAMMNRVGATSSVPGQIPPNGPPRREAMSGLRPGEYYVVAVDDLAQDDLSDPAVLDRLRSSAVRVNIPESGTTDVPLRRVSFADVMSQR